MRDFRGSLAVPLPRRHSDIVCFQYVTPWQWQAVAGLCHACNVLKLNRKTGVVADAWQRSTNVHSRGAYATTGSRCERRISKQKIRVRKDNALGRTTGRSTGLGEPQTTSLTEGVGAHRLASTTEVKVL